MISKPCYRYHDLFPDISTRINLVKSVFNRGNGDEKRYTQAQIIGYLNEAESGIPVKELCRKYGFSDASFYTWRSKYGGMEASDMKKLKEMELQNARLKTLLADTMLDKEALNHPGFVGDSIV